MNVEELTIETPDAIEHMLIAPDHALWMQTETAIFRAEPGNAFLTLIRERERREQLLGLFGTEGCVVLDDAGDLVSLAQDREIARRSGVFGQDHEVVTTRQVHGTDRAVVLVGRMTGADYELAVPQFEFIAIDAAGHAVALAAPVARRPRVWAVDVRRNVLWIEPEPDTGVVRSWSLDSGESVSSVALLAGDAERRLTALATDPATGTVAWAIGPTDGTGSEVRVENRADARRPIVLNVPRWYEPVESLAWSTDGRHLLLVAPAVGSAEATLLRTPRGRLDRPLPIATVPLGSSVFWWRDNIAAASIDDRVRFFAP